MFISYQKFNSERFKEEVRSAKVDFRILSDLEEEYLQQKEKILIEKPQQRATWLPDEAVGLDCVQVFISNMSTATTLEELDVTEGFTLPENLMSGPDTEWTAPKWAKAGDVVFFMHSKSARSTITRLRTKLIKSREKMPLSEFQRYMSYLEHELSIHAQYGGKIFAIGRVCGGPEYIEPEDEIGNVFHWRSQNYAAIDNIQTLSHPLDISEFRNYITLSPGSPITPLYDDEFLQLRRDIGKENDLPAFVRNAIARPIPLRHINAKNWIEVANDYRRCFMYEKQFRKFYVDFLLRDIGDQKKYFTECRCQRDDINDSFMDYVIKFSGKYLPVEVKLQVNGEPNIVGQVSKYVHNSSVFLTNDRGKIVSGADFHDGKVLIIDRDKLYMYDCVLDAVNEIYDLDQLQSKGDLQKVRQTISSILG